MFLSRGHVDPVYKIYLNGMPLEIVSEFRYLGVIIISGMLWSNQVKLVAVKAKAVIGMIYRKFYSFCNTVTLLKLYKAPSAVLFICVGSST